METIKKENKKSKAYLDNLKRVRRFLLPSFIPLIILTIGPTIFLYFISFTNYELGTSLSDAKIVWFDNYYRLFSGKDREFWDSVRITFVLGLASTGIEVILGVLLALLIDSLEKVRAYVVSVLMLPMVVTPVIVGLVWKLMLNSEHGVINWLLQNTVGLNPTWLGPDLSFISVLLVEVWQWTPFVMLIVLSGLASLPVEVLEMSEIDGANKFQKFFLIKLPLLQSILSLAILFRLIDVLKIFDIVYIMTAGGPGSKTEVLSIHSYRLGFANTGWIGRASATAVVLSLLTLVLSNFMIKQIRKSYKVN